MSMLSSTIRLASLNMSGGTVLDAICSGEDLLTDAWHAPLMATLLCRSAHE